ncbi:FxsA family protein [Alkalilacustris brevis]|uniref:FxsA family protein n=1 Tax=Alkalilacustris brevis TaxID=2026338 RepID=UPI000E0DB5D2|nr:FxsA family protein [Alkalilacustris brevis]
MWLFALFIVVPLIEIALFIQVGGWLTLWPTLGIVILTALAGTALMRQQGHRALADVQRSLERARDPLEPLAHGVMILFAGALLLTPGFLTDTIGFLLLIPPLRVAALAFILRHGVHRVVVGRAARKPGRAPGDPDIIDAEFEEVAPDERAPDRPGSDQQAGPPARGGQRRPSGWTRH